MNKIVKSTIATVGIAASLPAGALANDEYVAPQTFDEAKTNLDTETGKYNVSKKNADEKTSNKNVADKKFADSERNLKTAEDNVVKTDKQIDETIAQTKTDADKKVEDTIKNISDLKDKKTSLEKEIPAQEQAIEDAKSNVASAKAEVDKLKSENPTLAADISKTENEKNENVTKSNELTSQINSLNADKQNKQNEIASKNTAITSAKNELATKTSELEKAKADVASAQTAVNNAQSILNDLTAGNQAYENALANVNTAKANLERAKNVKAGIESRISAINTQIAGFTNAITNANNQIAAINSKIEALNSAKSAEINAADAVKTENENIESKKTELADANQRLTDAETRLAQENAKLDTLKSEKADLESKLNTEKENLAAAVKAAENAKVESQNKAKEQFNKGSLGFFETMGSADAVAELKSKAKFSQNGATFTDSTHIGAEDDATNLVWMYRSIQLAKIGNALRTKGDNNFRPMSALKISDRLMARAQVNANFSKDTEIGHSMNSGPNGDCSAGENLAWGYDWQTDADHPYKGWYDEEKQDYDNHTGGVTGHYTNLMDRDYIATGLAYAANSPAYGNTTSQVFKSDEAGSGTLYTLEEYEARFETYFTNLMETIEHGDPVAMKAAQDKVNEVQSKIRSIESDIANKNADIETQENAVSTVNSTLDRAKSDIETFTNELNELNKRPAQAAYDQAKENTKTAEKAVVDKLDELKTNMTPEQVARINAQSAENQPAEYITIIGEMINDLNAKKDLLVNGLAQANTDLANAENDIRDKETALSDANARLKALSGSIDEAMTALETSKTVLDASKATEAEKQKAVDDATTKLNALNTELTTLQNELNAIENSITDKTTQNTAVLAVIKDKEDKLVELNKTYDKVIVAEKKLDGATQDLKSKEKILADKRQELVDTINAIDENTTNLDKLKKRALAASALDRNNADTYKDFPEVKAAVEAYNKALKDVEDAKKTLADATTDRDVATEKYNVAMAELKESKFRYDRALADYNRLKPVEVKAKKYHASKKNTKRITKSKSPKTGDETALLANMSILALAGYAAAKTAEKRKNNK